MPQLSTCLYTLQENAGRDQDSDTRSPIEYSNHVHSEDYKEDYSTNINDLEPEIYGDYQLAPPKRKSAPVKPKSHSIRLLVTTGKNAPTHVNKNPTKHDHKPVYIPPEVIRIVCSFSNQASLRNALCLVCRQWYYLAKPFLRWSGRWICDSQSAEDALLTKMRGGRINELYVGYRSKEANRSNDRVEPYNKEDAAWARFCSAITTPVHPDDSYGPTYGLETATGTPRGNSKRSLLSYVENMTIVSKELWDRCLIPVLLPHLSNITSLTLTKLSATSSVSLLPILNHCCALLELSISAQTTCSVNFATLCYETGPSDVVSSTVVTSWTSYRLKSFKAIGLAFEPSTFSRLFQSCPELVEFSVTHFGFRLHRGVETILVPTNEAHIHLEPIYRLASSHCINLAQFDAQLLDVEIPPYASKQVIDAVLALRDAHIKQRLDLMAQYFPSARSIVFEYLPDDDWEFSPTTILYLGQLEHLTVLGQVSDRNLGMILHYARSLVELNIPMAILHTPNQGSVEKRYLAAVAKARSKWLRSRGLAPHLGYLEPCIKNAQHERQLLDRNYHSLTLSELATTTGSLLHPSKWPCQTLRQLEVHAVSCRNDCRYIPGEPRRFLAILAKSCPLLENLTLILDGLHIGQRICYAESRERQYVLPKKPTIRHRKCINKYHRDGLQYEKVDIECTRKLDNDLLALCGDHAAREPSRLVRLKSLVIRATVPGVIDVSDFDFLGSTSRGHVPWPKLEIFQILSWSIDTRNPHTKAIEVSHMPQAPLTKKYICAAVKERRPRLTMMLE
ncbi:hypothetical protein BG004_006248 [Podila humilis]|nr:hypothetical protein BG004_006248 [Podila humilis]